MIDSLEIINFQSHKHTHMEFPPGVSVLKGTSHHGKSTVIRSLRWLLFNKPIGVGFKSHFAGDKDSVEVAASFSEGTWVARIRDNENRYVSDTFDLKALKTDVPDEVNKITRINYINFQEQNDPYFLIGDTPGQAGKKLNEIVGLQIIDETRTKINQKVNKLNVEFNITAEELETTQKHLTKFKHVDRAERSVSRIENLTNKHNEYGLRAHKIKQTVDMVQANQKATSDLRKWLKVEIEHKKLTNSMDLLGRITAEHSNINTMVDQIKTYHGVIEEAKEIIALEPELKHLKDKQAKLLYVESTASKLSDICSAIRRLKKTRRNAQETLELDLKRKVELEKQLDYCQVCGSPRKYWRNSKRIGGN